MSLNNFIAAAAFLAAATAVTPAQAVSECITLTVNPVPTVCQGQSPTLGVSMVNSCSEAKGVGLTFDLDTKNVREKAEVTIEPLETLDKEVFLPLPAKTASGRHTVTVHMRDAAGNVASTDVYVVVDRCVATKE